jgi:isocitrate dehydrogenase
VVGRHTYSDIYRATELRASGKGKVTISYQPEGGRLASTLDVIDFGEGGGMAMAMHNTRTSIEDIARASFNVAPPTKMVPGPGVQRCAASAKS